MRHRRCSTLSWYARLRTIGRRRPAKCRSRSSVLTRQIARKAFPPRPRDTKSPRGRTSSRARLCACAPIRFLLQCYRRSQSLLLLLAACQSTSINRKSADPIDPKALAIFARLRVLGLALNHERLRASQIALDASKIFRQSPAKRGWPEKTRNLYRSASRLVLQVSCRFT